MLVFKLGEIVKKRHRIVALDLLRGFFLFVIIVDHINRFPNGFDLLTGRGTIWVSAAEGFMTISGILIGYIYGPKMLKRTKEVWLKLWRRALKIYMCTLGLSFFFIGYSVLFVQTTQDTLDFVALYQNNFTGLLFDSLTLQYVYGWGEFLSHYVIFLLIAPIILWLITRNRHFVIPVLVTSAAIWFVSIHPFVARSRYDFTASWQLLFVIGVVVGYYLPSMTQWLKKTFSSLQVRRSKQILYGLTLAIIGMSTFFTWGGSIIAKLMPPLQPAILSTLQWWDQFFITTPFALLVDKTSLGFLRIVFGAIVFWALYIFLVDHESKLPRPLHKFLRILGEKSLFVYGLQAVVVFFIGLYVANATSAREFLVLNTGVTTLALLLIYYITKNTSQIRQQYERTMNKIFYRR